MSVVDIEARYKRDEAVMKGATSIAKNPSLVLIVFLCALFIVVGVGVLFISGIPGWIIFATIMLVGGGAAYSGRGDSVMVAGVALLGGIAGILAIAVTLAVAFRVHETGEHTAPAAGQSAPAAPAAH